MNDEEKKDLYSYVKTVATTLENQNNKFIADVLDATNGAKRSFTISIKHHYLNAVLNGIVTGLTLGCILLVFK